MGFGVFDLDLPTTKTASALLALSSDDVSEMEPTACIRCGRCVEVCPGRVMPAKLMQAAVHGDEETFLKLNGMECCECGCCSYICPAKQPLTQTIKSMRKMQDEIKDLVVSVASKVVGDQVSAEDSSRLYDDFIAEMGEKK